MSEQLRLEKFMTREWDNNTSGLAHAPLDYVEEELPYEARALLVLSGFVPFEFGFIRDTNDLVILGEQHTLGRGKAMTTMVIEEITSFEELQEGILKYLVNNIEGIGGLQ
jgi:hypothetical protein